MTPFEYVSVLISIILGLGITFVLTGTAEIIKRLGSIQHYWPYHVWIVLVFVLHIQEWWAIYELRPIARWNLLSFLFVLLYPILLFVLANLLFPSKWSKKNLDLRTFYFTNYPKFFLIVVLMSGVSILQNISLTHYNLSDQLVQVIVGVTFLSLLLKRTESSVVHALLAVVMLALMMGSLLVADDIFTIGS